MSASRMLRAPDRSSTALGLRSVGVWRAAIRNALASRTFICRLLLHGLPPELAGGHEIRECPSWAGPPSRGRGAAFSSTIMRAGDAAGLCRVALNCSGVQFSGVHNFLLAAVEFLMAAVEASRAVH